MFHDLLIPLALHLLMHAPEAAVRTPKVAMRAPTAAVRALDAAMRTPTAAVRALQAVVCTRTKPCVPQPLECNGSLHPTIQRGIDVTTTIDKVILVLPCQR
jgi:hypothetical protein